jgi:hypothetical protein
MRLIVALLLAGIMATSATMTAMAADDSCTEQPTAHGRWWRPLVNADELLAERGECCRLFYLISIPPPAAYAGAPPRRHLPVIHAALLREWVSDPPRHQPPVIRDAKGLEVDAPGLPCHLPAQVPVRRESETAD